MPQIIFCLSILLITNTFFCADPVIQQSEEILSVLFQILFENHQLFPYIENKTAYALLLTSKCCNQSLSAYRKSNVELFDLHYPIDSNIHPQITKNSDTILQIDSRSVIFDASGNYASGYIIAHMSSDTATREERVKDFFKRSRMECGVCFFAYPLCEHIETVAKNDCGNLKQAITTLNRKLSFCIIERCLLDRLTCTEIVSFAGNASVWTHTKDVISNTTYNLSLLADENSITYKNDLVRTNAVFGIVNKDGLLTDAMGQVTRWLPEKAW